MEAEMKEKIGKTVRQILEESDMTEMTESKVRKLASEKLDVNLSEPNYKAYVRQVVSSFIDEHKAKEEEEEEEEEQQQANVKNKEKEKEYDDDGDLIVCRLSNKRKVSIQDFRGKTLVSIREYYKRDGKELPTSKGISLTEEQWSVFKKNLPAIEKAIKKMESRV